MERTGIRGLNIDYRLSDRSLKLYKSLMIVILTASHMRA